MKNLESGKDKIQKICDAIRKETIEPAKQEVRELLENARSQAAEIVREARQQAEIIQKEARLAIEEKQKVAQASLTLACRQTVETLKQKIEQKLFSEALAEMVAKEMSSPQLIVELIQSFMRSLEEQGIEEDFEVLIPKSMQPRSISSLLAKNVLERLKNHTVELGSFDGGVQIRMAGRQITIDISDKVVKELVAGYIRKDLRELVFQV